MSDGGGVSGAGDSSRTNLIVNYLPQNVGEKELFEMFSTIGPIDSCRVMKDFKTGYSFGFGFVNFVREEDAIRAIDTFNGYSLRNKKLKVSYARPSGEEIKDTNLYVTNLPRHVTEQLLETIFGKYGRIVQKHILRDKNSGTPRGIAFVRYDKREEAQEAISALNNVIPEGGTEPLCVKIAEEHGKQKAAFYTGWSAGMHQGRGDYGWGPQFPMMPEHPMGFPPMSPPLGGPMGPRAPRMGLRPPYPNPNQMKMGPRATRGRNVPWNGAFVSDDRFKQRFRNPGMAEW